MTTMPYTAVYESQGYDVLEYGLDHPDYCTLSSTPILPVTTYLATKELDITSDFISPGKSFTELLDGNDPIMNDYDYHHCANVSSPESDCAFMDDSKIIKPESYCEFGGWELFNVSSCTDANTELVCNPASITTAQLTPIASPHGQSPIMHPSMLPASLIDDEHDVTADVLNTQVVSTDRHQQEYQPIVVTPPQTPARSRGRRMTTRPAKPGTKCFECNYAGCGKVFKRSEHLKRHVRSIHTLERRK
jgi:hypothetical protein